MNSGGLEQIGLLKIVELNERQNIAIEFIKKHGMITLRDFRKISPKLADRTLRKDLDDLVKIGVIKPVGEKKKEEVYF